MSIDPTTGQFRWTPTELQGGASYQATITVTDNGEPALSDSETFGITVGAATPVDLGVIRHRVLADLDLGISPLHFRLETSQAGLLTLLSSDEDVELTLYNSAKSEVASAHGRIDQAVLSAGVVYYFDITGNGRTNLILTNLVRHNGTNVAVRGTDGNDTFALDASSADRQVAINGVAYQFSAGAATAFSFDGLDGKDDVQFIGASSPDTATLRPAWGTFAGEGYTLEVANIESIDYDGGPDDEVTIWGSRQTETYTAQPGRGWMTGENVSIDVTAERIYARGYGGGDTVVFEDSDGDDVLEYFATWARMRGEGYLHHVRGFSTMRANAELGQNGTDKVVVRGSGLNDYLKVNPYNADGQTVARFLSGSGSIWHIAFGFDTIVGYGRGGGIIDQLVLNDTPGTDTFELGRQEADLLTVEEYGVSITTYGFGNVELRRTYDNAGTDRVNLGDSHRPDHNDTLVGDPQQVTMTGPGYSNLVVGFPLVMAYSSGAGYDTAYFSDAEDPNDTHAGVDTFTGRPLFAQLEGPEYRLYARLFDAVHAESKYGLDIANLHGNANGAELTGTATEVRLSGTHSSGSYANHARSFHEVNAFGTSVADKAVLTDAAVDLGSYGPPSDVPLDELAQILWLDSFEKIERWDSGTGSKVDDIDNIDRVFAWWE